MPAARDSAGRFVKGSGSWTPAQHAAFAGSQKVGWSLSAKQLAAFEKKLGQYRGLPLAKRMEKGALLAAQYLAKPIRAGSPVGKTGNLKRSIRARYSRPVGNSKMRGASVGPTAPHRHLVIRGHKIVTHAGVFTGKFSTANSFVDKAVNGHQDEAMRIVSRVLFDNTSVFGSTGLSPSTRKLFGVNR